MTMLRITRPQLQIYEADGRVLTPPQDIPTPAAFDQFLDAPSLLVLPDGLMTVWIEGTEGAHVLRGSAIAADGTPGPALLLSDLSGLTGGYFTYLHDIRVFDDGSFGVLVYSETGQCPAAVSTLCCRWQRPERTGAGRRDALLGIRFRHHND